MYKRLDELLNDLKQCKICENAFGFEPHPIFLGSENSKIIQISQAPSAKVHESLKPFTDKSGDKLKYQWYQIEDEEFYDENNFYIAALAHCYPGKDSRGNDKLPPKVCYEKWIQEELKLINNELFILIGAKAAKRFFPHDNFNDLIFKDNYINDILTFVLPHPSPLNIKWFKDHPEFLEKRLFEIRKVIHEIIKGEENDKFKTNTKRRI